MKLYAVPWIYAEHRIDVQGPMFFGLCIFCILGELPAVIYERQKSRTIEQADSIPEISHSEAPSTSVFQAPQLAEDLLNIDAYCDLYSDVSSSETVIYERQKRRNIEEAESIPEISQNETPSTSVSQAPQLAEELHNIDADCDLNYDESSSETHSNPHESKFVLYYLTL